jgi:hypothetical protein
VRTDAAGGVCTQPGGGGRARSSECSKRRGGGRCGLRGGCLRADTHAGTAVRWWRCLHP